MFVRINLVLSITGLLCLTGCTDRGPTTIPVYGVVTFVGREMPKFCRLYFRPVESASITRPTFASPEPDGSYEVKSFRQSKGLLPGKYKVEVSYFNLKPGADPNMETSYVESVYDAGELVVDIDEGEVEFNIEVPPTTGRRT